MSAQNVLFHGRDVTLASGAHVVVNPWGVKTGRRMIGRLNVILVLFRAASSGELNLQGLLQNSYDELVSIAADAIGVKMSEIEDESQFLLEDIIAILTAVVEVNFINRPQFVAKILGLFATMEKMIVGEEADTETTETPTKDSPLPSSS